MIALLLCAALQTSEVALLQDAVEPWIRHGFPPGQVPPRGDDPLAAAAWDLAQLVPERVSGRAVDAETRGAAIARALPALAGLPEPLRATALARLRGELDAAGVALVGAMLLESPGAADAGLRDLLLGAPIELAAAPLYALALDEDQPAPERGVYAEHLLLALGRPALERLRPAVRAEAAPQFLRRVLSGWREMVAPEDLPWLEELARGGKEYAAQYALQLWAMHETDPERRLAVFRLGAAAEPSYRQVAWDALARGGPHPGIADELRALLDGGDADNRALARRLLPVYAGPEALWEAFLERAGDAAPQAQAPWMTALAASPLPEARAAAARWLAEHGRASGAVANSVARLLADDPEIDPFLPALLGQSGLPDRVLWPLALRRAETSEAARDALRERILMDDGLVQQQSIRHLAPFASEDDYALLEDLARGPEYAAASRAEALVALAREGRAAPLLAEWLEAPPRGYEVAEAFVRATVEFGTADAFARITGMLARGLGFPDPDEQRGVRIAAWQAAGRRGDAQALDFLAAEVARVLRDVAPLDGPWPSLYELTHDHFELTSVLDAAVLCAEGIGPAAVDERLRALPLDGVPDVARFLAAYRVGRFLPRCAEAWFGAVDRAALGEADRLRLLAAWAWSLDPYAGAAPAYAELLAEAPRYAAYARPLAEAFVPQGAGWTLFHDRIEERARVLRARGVEGEERLVLLAPLAHGRVEGGALADAVDLLAADPLLGAAGLAAARTLADRRVAQDPLSAAARAQRATLHEQAGAATAARADWEAVLRLVPRGTELREEAEAALLRLQE